MPYTDSGKAIMLRQLARAASHLALHSGIPDSANEIERGVYSRRKIDFADPATGRMRLTGEIPFDVPDGANVTHGGLWTDPAGGVLLAWGPVEPATFEARGIYVIDAGAFDLNLDSA
jgi:hypothetical protein